MNNTIYFQSEKLDPSKRGILLEPSIRKEPDKTRKQKRKEHHYYCSDEARVKKVKVRPFIFTFFETSIVEPLSFHFSGNDNTHSCYIYSIIKELTSVGETSRSYIQRQFSIVPLGTNMLHGLEYTSTITPCVNLEHNDLPLGRIDVS